MIYSMCKNSSQHILWYIPKSWIGEHINKIFDKYPIIPLFSGLAVIEDKSKNTENLDNFCLLGGASKSVNNVRELSGEKDKQKFEAHFRCLLIYS